MDPEHEGTAEAVTASPVVAAPAPEAGGTTAPDRASGSDAAGGNGETAAPRPRRRRGGRGRGRGGGASSGAAARGDEGAEADDAGSAAADADRGDIAAPLTDRAADVAADDAAAAFRRGSPVPRQTASGSGNAAPRSRAGSTAGTRSRSPGEGAKTRSAQARPARSRSADGDGAAEPVAANDATTANDAMTVTADEVTEATGEATPAAGTGTGAKRRRRRGGRGRGGKKPATGTADGDGLAEDETDETAADRTETVQTQRDDATPDTDRAATGSRSRSRRQPASRRAATSEGGSDGSEATDAPRSGRGAKKTTSTPAAKAKPLSVEEQIAAGGPTRGIRSTRSRTGRDGSRRRREQSPPPPRVTDKLMVITEHGDRDQIAVLEEDMLVQHYVTRQGATSMVGNIYLGRVQNVLPGMEAAFVDVGRGRNGVLYAGEVNYSPEDIEGPAQRIEQLLKPGQSVMVQVTKDPMGGKGARLTANLSLAGRFLVLAPNQSLSGISRRLSDEERKKLKTILKKVKPDEHGVIVRTAAEGATEQAITTDLERQLSIWNDIQKRAKKAKAPAVLYEEPELTVRVVRDLFTDEEFRGLVTDSKRVHGKVMDYVRDVAPDLEPKVTLHTGKLPAFEEHRVVEQIHKALDRKVWLPSGGYLIIERTEAMTIVDVNTGKAVGKTNLEETVVNTNLEASREVARQLRLRDIGGIIVIDFIDMLLEKNKKQVEDTMRDALALDKTRSQVFEIGPLGLMQVTRKRVSSGLVESFSETCPTCEGRGILVNYDVQ